MASAVEFADTTFKGVVRLEHFGGCYIEAVDVNRTNGFRPLDGSWEPAFEAQGISIEDRRDPLRDYININDIPDGNYWG